MSRQLSVRQSHWRLNRGAADYQTTYAGGPQRETLDRTRTTLKLTANARGADWRIFSRVHVENQEDQLASDNEHRFDGEAHPHARRTAAALSLLIMAPRGDGRYVIVQTFRRFGSRSRRRFGSSSAMPSMLWRMSSRTVPLK